MWAALTEAEIETSLSGTELSTLRTKALASGQVDPLTDVLLQVTDEVRGYIAAKNVLGPAGTLPPQVRGAAIAMARWRLTGRLSVGTVGSMMQGEARRKDYDDAIALCKQIAAGKFAPEEPETAGPEEIPTSESKFGGDEKLDF